MGRLRPRAGDASQEGQLVFVPCLSGCAALDLWAFQEDSGNTRLTFSGIGAGEDKNTISTASYIRKSLQHDRNTCVTRRRSFIGKNIGDILDHQKTFK